MRLPSRKERLRAGENLAKEKEASRESDDALPSYMRPRLSFIAVDEEVPSEKPRSGSRLG